MAWPSATTATRELQAPQQGMPASGVGVNDIVTKLDTSNRLLAKLVQAVENRAARWEITGALPIAEGGTGATTAVDTRYNLLGLDADQMVVPRLSTAAPLMSGGLLYTQLGKVVYTIARSGQILGIPWGAIAEGSESAENMISFGSDSVLLIGAIDRPDIFIEAPSFMDVTIRRFTFNCQATAIGTTPPGGFTSTLSGTGAFNVEANTTYGRLAHFSTGATSGSTVRLEHDALNMQIVNSCRLGGFFYVAQSTNQFVSFGYMDTALNNYVRMSRTDTGSEGTWSGEIRIGGGAVTSVTFSGVTTTGTARRFMAVYITPTGVEFYIGDSLNLPTLVGTYTGSIPTAAVSPSLYIQNSAAANKDLYLTIWQEVWPG